jgi:hypothetical protein
MSTGIVIAHDRYSASGPRMPQRHPKTVPSIQKQATPATTWAIRLLVARRDHSMSSGRAAIQATMRP